MQSLRRKSTSLLSVAGVRSSLAFNSVASIAGEESASFAAVLARTMSTAQSFGDDVSQEQKTESQNKNTNSKKGKEKTGVIPGAISMLSPDSSIDLCERLETMLQHKSLLIAVA